MDDTVFKTAVPTPTSVVEDAHPLDPSKADHVAGKSELPPSLFGEAHKAPLVASELGLESFINKFDTKELSFEVDSFINEEIKRLHLKDDPTTYKDLLKQYEHKLGLEDVDDAFIKLEKISQYVRIQQKLLNDMAEHDKLMSMDISELSATKLKKIMGERYGIRQA